MRDVLLMVINNNRKLIGGNIIFSFNNKIAILLREVMMKVALQFISETNIYGFGFKT